MTHQLLICTDLDRTLLPNGSQTESENARHYFRTLVERPEVTLAYVSGRHRDLVKEAIEEYHLPLPNFVVGDVGTTIYHVEAEQEWTLQEEWQEEIAKDWGGKSHVDVMELLTAFEPLRLQEKSKQNHYKASYYAPLQIDQTALIADVGKQLSQAGIKASLIWSVDEPAETGLLDVLPEQATKFHAVEALMKQGGFTIDNTVFCGDSGNDIEALTSPIPGVLVANSQVDVQELAQQLATENGSSHQLYLAKGGFLGMNGHYSGGILEGIAHFHPYISDWIKQGE